jgi:hypothetical protein
MHFRFHAITQCGIHQLMALNQALAFKLGTNHRCIKMLAIALYRKVATSYTLLNIGLNLFWGWKHLLLHKVKQLNSA